MTNGEPRLSRRELLGAAAGGASAAIATGGAAAQNGTQTGGQAGTGTGGNATGGGTGNGTAGQTGNGTAGQTGNGTAGQTGQTGGQTHTVDMTNDLVYDPDSITIAVGDTIEWVNVGSIGHSVTAYADQIPSDASYFASGGFDSEQAARNAFTAGNPDSGFIAGGESYQHTFQTAGEYQYFCIPHEAAGMVGSVTVESGGGAPAGGGGGGTGGGASGVPNFARTAVVALTAALLGVLSFTYFFIRFGGDYSMEE